MTRNRIASAMFVSPMILVLVFLCSGCGAPKPIAPVFNLYGYQRIAVIPFNNETRDPALGKAVEDEVVEQVLSLGAVPIIESAQVWAYLKEIHANSMDIKTDADLRKKIADKFKCDLFLLGTATGYTEILKDKAPEQVSGEWGFYTYRKVQVDGNAQLVDASTGSLLWKQKNGGYSWTNTWNPLPVPSGFSLPPEFNQAAGFANFVKNRVLGKDDHEPAAIDESDPSILLYKKNHYFTGLREKAVYQLADGFVGDFRGHGGWRADGNYEK